MRKIDDSGKCAWSVLVERPRRREVAAERLLDDDARVSNDAGLGQPRRHGAEQARRDGEVEGGRVVAARAPRAALSKVLASS